MATEEATATSSLSHVKRVAPEEVTHAKMVGLVTPHLTVENCEAALNFWVKALGAKIIEKRLTKDQKIIHAAFKIGKTVLYACDNLWGSKGPAGYGGSPCMFNFHVDDVDAAVKRAVEAGATVTMPVDDMFWGDRYGVVKDPSGYSWSFSKPSKKGAFVPDFKKMKPSTEEEEGADSEPAGTKSEESEAPATN
eukprot:INCI4258.1.p1 GENE.INCI4258.1~~INCI4258.1.p1  ORF type:complete len:193 (+),score=37.68 INCI4258.1:70-648(+)